MLFAAAELAMMGAVGNQFCAMTVFHGWLSCFVNTFTSVAFVAVLVAGGATSGN